MTTQHGPGRDTLGDDGYNSGEALCSALVWMGLGVMAVWLTLVLL